MPPVLLRIRIQYLWEDPDVMEVEFVCKESGVWKKVTDVLEMQWKKGKEVFKVEWKIGNGRWESFI